MAAEAPVLHLPSGEWTARPAGLWEPPTQAPTVEGLVASMDEAIVGLAPVKQRLAIALQAHVSAGLLGIRDRQPNIIACGPTGGGKTALAAAACEAAGLPYIDVNLTEFSETGFVGKDLSQMLLFFNDPRWMGEKGTHTDLTPLAERWGVVILDEFDKLAYRAGTGKTPLSDNRQVEKKLQYELLRFSEGVTTTVRVDDDEAGYPFSTDNLLFIALGAFQSYGDIGVEYHQVQAEHVIRYGFLPELVGRFSSVLGFPALQQGHLVSILKGSFLPWYTELLNAQGVSLEVSDSGCAAFADVVIKEGIGARGLQGELERCLWRARGQARPGDRIEVDYNDVSESGPGGGARLVRGPAWQ